MKSMLRSVRFAVIAPLITTVTGIASARDVPGSAPEARAQPATAVQKSFDVFVGRLAAQWMRADPISASAHSISRGGVPARSAS